MDKARYRQAVFRNFIVNGMPAADNRSRFKRFISPASQYLFYTILRHFFRNAKEIERQLRRPSHCINIAERICRRDLPEQVRVIRNRRKKIRCKNQSRFFVDLVNGCIIRCTEADQ